MSTLAARMASVLILGVVLALSGAPAAVADAPTAAGWWNLAHQQFQPPSPPDVGPDDLYLQGGPGAPSAFAALRFVVPPDAAVGPLVLPLNTSAVQRADAVVACPTTAAWVPARNARYAAAPTYSCARSVAAVRSEDGKALVLAGIARLVAEDGTLDVALVPGPSDRLVLSSPPATALTVTSPPPAESDPGAFDPGPAFPTGPMPTGEGVAPVAPFFSDPVPPISEVGAPAFQAPVVPPVPGPAPASAAAPVASPITVAARVDDDRTRLLVSAEALLVLAFFGLLGYGPLRWLQVLTGQPVATGPVKRGIGRFASARAEGPVPHL